VTDDPARVEREEALARHAAATAARGRLEELRAAQEVPAAAADRLLHSLDQRVERTRRRLDQIPDPASSEPPPRTPGDGSGAGYRRLRRDLLSVETAELMRLRNAGTISEDVRRRVQRSLDIEEAGLDDF
jgi:monovalent cation/hydrogen antiporter